ncbi:MAG: protein translocase subunit SecF [Actinobacteria bacterium]|nr:protein translocase subunit SecF [Actinomycetota bacterium]MCL6105537.1 protein translocase subunit SecF [Actinomycetota bacterium]
MDSTMVEEKNSTDSTQHRSMASLLKSSLAPWVRLYRGGTSFDFVGKRKRWFVFSSVVIMAGLVSLGVKGLNFGIDFSGGTSWQVSAPGVSVAKARSVLTPIGLGGSQIVILGGRTLSVETNLNSLSSTKRSQLESEATTALAALAHVPSSEVSITDIGPTWGGLITQKALIALIAFFLGITLYITLRFEWKMAMAALIAVVHDILVAVGIYSISGFQVTPDTVVAFLTILGYSLYDTIVVFDRVEENAKGLGATGKFTYSDTVNLSMNQVLARSINTSLAAILPIMSVLVLGAYILGAITLQYFGLALLIGLLSGAYSSIFIASPLLAVFKEHEPRYATIRQRLSAKGELTGILTPKSAALATGGVSGSLGIGGVAGGGGSRGGLSRSGGAGVLRPQARTKIGVAKTSTTARTGTARTGTAGTGTARTGVRNTQGTQKTEVQPGTQTISPSGNSQPENSPSGQSLGGISASRAASRPNRSGGSSKAKARSKSTRKKSKKHR